MSLAVLKYANMLVEVALRDRVEFVVVALGAAERQAEDGFAERFHAIDVVVGEILFGNRAALVRVHVVALEAGGDELGLGAIGQQVAGELLAEELVVGHIRVERVDDPVAPEPHVPAAVDREAVRVGIAGGVEPDEGHAFAEVRAGEQAVDEAFVGIGRGDRRLACRTFNRRAACCYVGDEGFDLFGRGRQAGEVERHAADKRAAVGFGRVFQSLGIEACEDEVVDFVPRPRFVRHLGDVGFHRRDERPVFLVRCALLDPAFEFFFLFGFELVMRIGWRHHFRIIARGDAAPELALLEVAGDNRDRVVVEFGVGGHRLVEPQVGLAGLGVEAVAFETVFGKDRADVAVEGELLLGGRNSGASQANNKQW